jgi:hypothetical protein
MPFFSGLPLARRSDICGFGLDPSYDPSAYDAEQPLAAVTSSVESWGDGFLLTGPGPVFSPKDFCSGILRRD